MTRTMRTKTISTLMTMRTTRKMRRKKKRKIGSSLLAIVLALLLTSDVIAGTKKRKPEAGQYGMVAVTVFREPGFALPGAELVLIPSPESGPPPGKSDFLTGKSDARGEYVFRVPTAAMRYKLKA